MNYRYFWSEEPSLLKGFPPLLKNIIEYFCFEPYVFESQWIVMVALVFASKGDQSYPIFMIELQHVASIVEGFVAIGSPNKVIPIY